MSNRPVASIFCALLLSASACYRAQIDLGLVDGGEGGDAGAGVSPRFGGSEPENGAITAGSESVSRKLMACLQPLEPLQTECLFLGADVCEESPLAGELKACDGGCSVCEAIVADYPYYFAWHRCCQPQDCAAGFEPTLCDARCPAPTEHDKIAPCELPDRSR